MPADLADRTDFDNAERGLIARLEPGVIKNGEGRGIGAIDVFGVVTQGPCPPTVHPSQWRQAKLTATQIFDTIAIRIDGSRAASTALSVL